MFTYASPQTSRRAHLGAVFTVFALAIVGISLPAVAADGGAEFATLNLPHAGRSPTGCSIRWLTWPNGMFWIDDTHIAIRTVKFCRDRKQRKAQDDIEQLFVFDTDQRLKSIAVDGVRGILRKPAGGLLIVQKNHVEMLSADLQLLQSLHCPIEGTPCSAFVPAAANSDRFAVCSILPKRETCVIYTGRPSNLQASSPVVIDDPYGIEISPFPKPEIPKSLNLSPISGPPVDVGSGQLWFVDRNGVLTALLPDGSTQVVSKDRWTPKDSNCRGETSMNQPRRYMAVCVGAYVWTDGDLDSIFGYSRVAVFDVAQRKIILRLSGRAYTNAALSPSGQLVAVSHDTTIKLYRAP